MDDFYKALDEMSKNPSDMAYREPVLQNALAFTKHINETAKRLQNMKTETEYEIEIKIKNVNNLSDQISKLNRQIYSAEIDGKPANDLRDRRELLVDELSKIVNVRVNETSDGKYSVSVGGISIVDHLYNNEISLKVTPEAGGDKYTLHWENGGEVILNSGELKGLLDMVQGDGQNNTYRGIPFYMNQLDEFAKGFADKFNSIHEQGYGIGDNVGGREFFTYDTNSSATLTVNQEIIDDIKLIAGAGNQGGSAEDNTNLIKLINQREDKGFFGAGTSQGTPDDFIKAMLSSMAVDNVQAQRIYKTQELMQKNIEVKRSSISGVELNEEMSDMIRFQHVYVAASKMVSTMDMLIDVTVNRLGLVGR